MWALQEAILLQEIEQLLKQAMPGNHEANAMQHLQSFSQPRQFKLAGAKTTILVDTVGNARCALFL